MTHRWGGRVLAVLALVGVLAGCVVSSGTSETGSVSLDAANVTSAGDSASASTSAGDVIAENTAPPPTCTYAGSDPFINLDLTFTNPLGEVSNVRLSYALLASGVRFGDGDEGFLFPGANEQFRVREGTIEELPAEVDEQTVTCEVIAVEEFSLPFERGPEVGTCVIQRDEASGSPRVELLATNPFAQTRDVAFFYALRAQDSVRFGFGEPMAHMLRGGEQVRFTEKVGDLPSWVDPAAVTCDVLGYYGR